MAESAPNVPRGLGLALLASIYLSASSTVLLTPVLPSINAHYADIPHAAFLTKALITVVGFDAVIGSPITALLVRPLGARTLMIAACILFILGGLGGLVAQDLRFLVFTRFLVGLAGTVVTTAAVIVIVTNLPPAARNRWIGYLAAAGTVWAALTSSLSGLVAETGWRNIFWLHLLAVPILLAIWIGMRDVRPAEGGAPASTARPFAVMARYWWVIPIGLATGMGGTAAMIYLPFRLAETSLGTPTMIGTLFLLFTICAGVSSVSYGLIRRWTSPIMVYAIAGSLLALVMTGFLLARQDMAIIALMLAGGIGTGLLGPNLYGLIANLGDDDSRRILVGISKAAYFTGPFAGQLLITSLSGNTPSGTIRTLAILFALSIALCGIAMMRQSRHREHRIEKWKPVLHQSDAAAKK